MIVTQISEVSGSRRRIDLDGQFAFVLYKGELSQYHIKEGRELTPQDYREIMTELLPRRAKLRCMNLLKARDYTKKQLKDKLTQGGYPQECIDEAIAYAESYHYIDDLRYAKDYIEYHLAGRSKMRIETDLMRKGIDGGMIKQAFAQLDESGIEQDEAAMVSELLRKKKYCTETATREEQQKMYGFLYRRGFPPEVIAKALL